MPSGPPPCTSTAKEKIIRISSSPIRQMPRIFATISTWKYVIRNIRKMKQNA